MLLSHLIQDVDIFFVLTMEQKIVEVCARGRGGVGGSRGGGEREERRERGMGRRGEGRDRREREGGRGQSDGGWEQR